MAPLIFRRQRDFNPPEQRAAQRTLSAFRFTPGWPARHRRAASLAADAPSKCVLGRQVLILQQEFLVDQSGHVGQKPRACGCVRPQRPS
jgi:hypothetical protein